jgi:hypothetical protein
MEVAVPLSRWGASLAATAGLAGSVLFGAQPSAAADTPASTAERSSAVADSARPAPGRQVGGQERQRQDRGTAPGRGTTRCLGLVPSPYPYAQTQYECNDWRLGPTRLPRTGVIGSTLDGYHRLGRLTPVEFLNKWWDPNSDFGQGDWKYSLIPDDGFAHASNGKPIAAEVTLHAGQLLDRFGSEFGKFLAPAGAKYSARSIPPSGLDTQDPRFPYNYHLYRVKKDTLVCAGPTAPAFEQPGMGVQYVTSVTVGSPYCPNVQTGATVSSLLRNNLVRVN